MSLLCQHSWLTNKLVDYFADEIPDGPALKTSDSEHNCLLHCIGSTTPLEVVKRLVFRDRDALKTPNKHGDLPLHCCVALNIETAAQLLLSKFPEAAGRPNNDGEFPVHMMDESISPELVEKLYLAGPAAFRTVTESGDTVIHRCVEAGVTCEVLKLVIEYNPERSLIFSGNTQTRPVSPIAMGIGFCTTI